MVGTTAQITALTCYLNARLRENTTSRFFPDNSTCQFCESIQFLNLRQGWFQRGDKWEVVYRTPDEWMDSIISDGCSRALLIHTEVDDINISDRLSAGFVGGGGRWLLCVQSNKRACYWQARWQVGNRKAHDRRIWRVEYGRIAETAAAPSDGQSVASLSGYLAKTLAEIGEFSHKNNLSNFAGCFEKAQWCLKADDPLSSVYHRDLAPGGALPMDALRLLSACQVAWVFGGMGSWNDLSFDGDDQKRYQQLSDQLFGLLNTGICAAVNASAGR